MSLAAVVGQIDEIRARLAQLAPVAVRADSGASFASALSGATTSAASAASATGAVTTGAGVTGDDVVTAALQYKGVPYVLGGESKSGIDCSGLVQSAFKDTGVSVPRLVHEQQTIGTKVDSLKDAKPGDLIVLNGGDHIAIYAGNDTVIHAPYAGRTVSVQKAWFTDKDIVTIRRVVPATDDAAAAATAASGTSSTLGAASTTASPAAAAAAATTSSTAATSQAAAMLAMYGASDSSSSSSGSSDSMAALMASISSTASGSTTSGSTAQQLLAARTALLGTGS